MVSLNLHFYRFISECKIYSLEKKYCQELASSCYALSIEEGVFRKSILMFSHDILRLTITSTIMSSLKSYYNKLILKDCDTENYLKTDINQQATTIFDDNFKRSLQMQKVRCIKSARHSWHFSTDASNHSIPTEISIPICDIAFCSILTNYPHVLFFASRKLNQLFCYILSFSKPEIAQKVHKYLASKFFTKSIRKKSLCVHESNYSLVSKSKTNLSSSSLTSKQRLLARVSNPF